MSSTSFPTFTHGYTSPELISDHFNEQESIGAKIFRHTAGRVNEVGKFIIDTVGSVLMLTKGVLKLPIALVYSPIILVKDYLDSRNGKEVDASVNPFSLRGAGKDVAMAAKLFKRALGSLLNVFVAPNTKDCKESSFKEFKKVIKETVFEGRIHTTRQGNSNGFLGPVDLLFK